MENECENTSKYEGGKLTCEDLYNCCDCGCEDSENGCGCAYCWSCNACETCKAKH